MEKSLEGVQSFGDGGTRKMTRALLAIMFLAAVLRVGSYLMFPNIHYADEIFQHLEPAYRLWTGEGVVTWEWREGIRSWFLPGVIAFIMRLGSLAPESPSVYLSAVAFSFALYSTWIVYLGFRAADRLGGTDAAIITGLLCAIWPDLVYFGPKTLGEVAAAPMLLAAACFSVTLNSCSKTRMTGPIVAIGALCGAVFCLRFHLAPVLLLIAAWTCRRDIRGCWAPFVFGASLPLVPFGLLDWWSLGTPFQSIWKNFYLNIVTARSAEFGTAGPFWYLKQLLLSWRFAAVPLLLCFALGIKKAPLFALCAFTIVLTFSFIPHKEMRFVFPAIPFIVIVSGVGTLSLLRLVREASRSHWPLGVKSACLAWTLLCVLDASATKESIGNWTRSRDILAAQARIATSADVCGVAFVNVDWYKTGGASRMHSPGGLYAYGQSDFGQGEASVSTEASAAFNYALTTRTSDLQGFQPLQCWGDVCVARRSGACTRKESQDINSVLRSVGH